MIPRSEHPRPDFQRENWLCLNGQWDFSFGTDCFDRSITVPYACETKLSGIHDKGFHDTVWYCKHFSLPQTMVGKRVFLHFGAVDYQCDLWVNEHYVRSHTGGQTSFKADITDALVSGENVIKLKVCDDHADMEMPRGKQYWKLQSEGIFYSRSTGIWQSVWLEAVAAVYLADLRITPIFDDGAVNFQYTLSAPAKTLVFDISFGAERMVLHSVKPEGLRGSEVVTMPKTVKELAWSPEFPRLIDVTVRVYDDAGVSDQVYTYFGLRKVSIDNGVFMLNNQPYYQKLVLDQGYWESSLMTAPTDEDFIRDIELTKAMGFNGVRKHQKVEDPRYLYHADRLGLLVWGEIGSSRRYSVLYAQRMYAEWMEAVNRDYNHPCIVAWTPLNESWGVGRIRTERMQQAHCDAMVAMTKSVDQTRVVLDNDGWEHTCGDFLTLHDYTSDGAVLQNRYSTLESILAYSPAKRDLFVAGYSYQGQPVLLSEFGGIKYVPGEAEIGSWGYCETASAEAYTEKLMDLIGAIHACPLLQGYCYTQLTDVEAEKNGLLTYSREPKLPLQTIRSIVEGT